VEPPARAGAGTTQFTACHPDNPDAGWDIASIRLSWTLADGSCPAPACSQAWSCDDNHGATAFDVPRGIANLLSRRSVAMALCRRRTHTSRLRSCNAT